MKRTYQSQLKSLPTKAIGIAWPTDCKEDNAFRAGLENLLQENGFSILSQPGSDPKEWPGIFGSLFKILFEPRSTYEVQYAKENEPGVLQVLYGIELRNESSHIWSKPSAPLADALMTACNIPEQAYLSLIDTIKATYPLLDISE